MTKKNKISKKIKRKTKRKILSKKNKKVEQLFLKPVFTEKHMKSKEGEYFDRKFYTKIIDEDCDCYAYDENNKPVAF